MWQLRATPGLSDGLRMVGRRPRVNCGVQIQGPALMALKQARKVLLDALRGRISGLLLKDVKRYGALRAVDINTRLVWVCGE